MRLVFISIMGAVEAVGVSAILIYGDGYATMYVNAINIFIWHGATRKCDVTAVIVMQ